MATNDEDRDPPKPWPGTDWPPGVKPVTGEELQWMQRDITVEFWTEEKSWQELGPMLDEIAAEASWLTVRRNNPRNPVMGGGLFDLAVHVVLVLATIGGAVGASEKIVAAANNLRGMRGAHFRIEDQDFYLVGRVSNEEAMRRIEQAMDMVEAGSKHSDAPLGWVYDQDEGSWLPARE